MLVRRKYLHSIHASRISQYQSMQAPNNLGSLFWYQKARPEKNQLAEINMRQWNNLMKAAEAK